MNPTLKLIPDSFDQEERDRAWNSIPDEEKCHNGGWYFHGELCELLGFDLGFATNAVSLGLTVPVDSKIGRDLYINGVYPCEIEGVDKPCIGYFWTCGKDESDYRQRGLVCFTDDVDACKYAEEMYNEKSVCL